MSDFIAKIGYTLMWGFGIPEYSLEERFEDYYKVGLLITIIGIAAIVVLLVLSIWYLKKGNEVEEDDR